MSALELPTLPATRRRPEPVRRGARSPLYVDLPRGEEPLTIASLAADGRGLALGTAQGVVKRVTARLPGTRRLGGRLAQGRRQRRRRRRAARRQRGPRLRHLRRPAAALPGVAVRPQGRAAGGMAGIKPRPRRQRSPSSGRSTRRPTTVVVTSAGSSDALPGTAARRDQGHPLRRVPRQGSRHRRRSRHRFLRGEDALVLAWVGAHAGPRLRRQRGRRSSSPRRPAGATAPARPSRRSSPGSARPSAEPSVPAGPPPRPSAEFPCYGIVTAMRHGDRCADA